MTPGKVEFLLGLLVGLPITVGLANVLLFGKPSGCSVPLGIVLSLVVILINADLNIIPPAGGIDVENLVLMAIAVAASMAVILHLSGKGGRG